MKNEFESESESDFLVNLKVHKSPEFFLDFFILSWQKSEFFSKTQNSSQEKYRVFWKFHNRVHVEFESEK